MRIQYGSTLLATGDLTAPAARVALNGRQIVDEAHLLRALQALVLARGNRAHSFAFATVREFASVRTAERFVLLHEADLADQDDLHITCGEGSDTEVVTLADAALEGWRTTPAGLSVAVEYTFRGARFAAGEPEDIPDEETILKRASADLTSGERSGAVVFASAFGAAPIVTATVVAPSGTVAILGVTVHTVLATGFSYVLTAAPPAAGYKLHWQAASA